MQPFWFWNGDMRKEEIVRQIKEMKAKGIPGFLIHPRQGMEVPYMSKEFFDRVKIAVQAAKENDMEVWLYDEYPYPSGICGGEVLLERPELRSRRLEKVVETVEGGREIKLFAPWGRVLLARAYPVKGDTIATSEAMSGSSDNTTDKPLESLDHFIDLQDCVGTGYCQEVFQYSGLTEYNRKRYFTGDQVKYLDWNAPEGIWKIYLVTETETKHFKYFENFIDTLNPEATRYFIQLTHERYKREIGEEFGKTVRGIFTDEITAFPDTQPWSPLLPGEVLKRHGVDLISSLPALWEDLGEVSAKVRYAYWNTATELFIDAYDKQVHEWCRANGLLYIGEKPILRSKQLQHFDIPGIDAGHQKVGSVAKMVSGKYRANGKMASSAAHFYDKPAALCEAGHSIGWGMTMQDMKWIFDWLAVQGIDFFVIHGFFYTADGLKKHDAPPSAFYQMPWWEDAAVLTSYASGLGHFLQTTERRIKLLAIDPVTSAWTSDRPTKALLQEDFARLQNQLLFHGLDYYIIDPELFAQGETVCVNGSTEFVIHGESYEAVLLPPMRNLEKEACGKLLELARKGGKICGLYSVPFEQIQEGCDTGEFNTVFGVDALSLWDNYRHGKPIASKETGNCYLAGNIQDAVSWLSRQLKIAWEVSDKDGLGRDQLPMVWGTSADGQERLFLANTSKRARELEIRNPLGETTLLSLAAYQSLILECKPTEAASYLTLDLNQKMPFTISHLNALRLGFWQMRLPDGQEATVEAAPLIDQLEAGSLSCPVVQKPYFGCPKELAFPETKVNYCTRFFCSDSIMNSTGMAGSGADGAREQNPIYLVMEPGTFLGEWEIRMNGHIFREEDFVQKKIYLDTNLAVEAGKYLVPGWNEITVEMNVKVSFGGMRNPLYLFGKFGVERLEQSWNLTRLSEAGRMEDYTALGLPFYYGEAVFTGELSVPAIKGEFVSVRLSADWLTDSVRLAAGGYETAPCAWQPYMFKIPSRYLKEGKNRIQIKVLNTALGLYEGQKFNRERHAYESVSVT